MKSNHPTLTLHVMNLILAAVIGLLAYIDFKLAAQTSALVAVTWLSVLLIVPRIMNARALQRFHNDLLEIAKQSKWLGLWIFAWFTFYLTFAIIASLLPTKASVLGGMVEVILLALALISNNWSYANIKYWKHINMAAWALPFLLIAHFIASGSLFADNLVLHLALVKLLAIVILAGFVSFFAKSKKKTDNWRLVALCAGLAIALIVVFY